MVYLVRPPFLLKKFYPEFIWRVDTSEKIIYLSFDDGPHATITTWILDQLNIFQAKASFFCVGSNVIKYPEIYSKILEQGHTCGNHTHDHINGWKTDSENYLNNIKTCSQYIKSRLFRPPYGRLKKSQSKKILQNYSIVMWDVLSGDFDRKIKKEKCLDRVLKNSKEGSIVVFHDSEKAKEKLFYVLPRFLEAMTDKGFRFEALNTVFP